MMAIPHFDNAISLLLSRHVHPRPDRIRQHLQQLLNTRQGTVAACPDYGMPDISRFYQQLPHSLNEMVAAIDYAIRHYEKRLCDIEINLDHIDESQAVVCMTIDAVCDDAPVRYSSVCSPNGYITLENRYV